MQPGLMLLCLRSSDPLAGMLAPHTRRSALCSTLLGGHESYVSGLHGAALGTPQLGSGSADSLQGAVRHGRYPHPAMSLEQAAQGARPDDPRAVHGQQRSRFGDAHQGASGCHSVLERGHEDHLISRQRPAAAVP